MSYISFWQLHQLQILSPAGAFWAIDFDNLAAQGVLQPAVHLNAAVNSEISIFMKPGASKGEAEIYSGDPPPNLPIPLLSTGDK